MKWGEDFGTKGAGSTSSREMALKCRRQLDRSADKQSAVNGNAAASAHGRRGVVRGEKWSAAKYQVNT